VELTGDAIEQRGGHLGIAEDAGPFAEAEWLVVMTTLVCS
jgi:hypothetical protein